MNTDLPTIGVIVARFQVNELHAGHRHLINQAYAHHEKVLVVLGTPEFPTPRNPLSYRMRKGMVEAAYPGIMVAKIDDHPSNDVWSANLDRIVREHCGNEKPVLYGARDSFFSVYSGQLEFREVDSVPGVSGTACRKAAAEEELCSSEFLRGIIYAYEKRLAVVRPMVDIAVIRPETREVLLAGKATDPADKWRFIGGLVDPNESLEQAAKREVHEEASDIEVDDLRYVGSKTIADWRYSGSGEYGVTTLFRGQYIFGAPRAADDIVRLKWIRYEDLIDNLLGEHKPLGELLITSLKKNGEL